MTNVKHIAGLNFSYLVSRSIFAFAQKTSIDSLPCQFNLYHNIREIDPRTLSLSFAHSAKRSAKRVNGEVSEAEGSLVKCTLSVCNRKSELIYDILRIAQLYCLAHLWRS